MLASANTPQEGVTLNVIAPLSTLEVGLEGRVVEVRGAGALRRRLLDLGFTPGATVKAVRRAPLGSPTAFLVRGTVIALRPSDASTVLVMTSTDTGGDAQWV